MVTQETQKSLSGTLHKAALEFYFYRQLMASDLNFELSPLFIQTLRSKRSVYFVVASIFQSLMRGGFSISGQYRRPRTHR